MLKSVLLSETTIIKACRMFDKKTQRRMLQISIVQLILGSLDLIGVGLVGVIGALAVTGVKSGLPGGRIYSLLSFFGMQHLQFQQQVAVLGFLAVLVLIGKTLISAFYTRRILHFLGNKGAELSTWIIKTIFSKSYLFLRSKNQQEIIHNSTYGVNSLTLGVIGGTLTLLSDFSLTVVIGVALIVIDPVIAGVSFIIFGTVMIFLIKITQQKTRKLGERYGLLSVESSNLIEKASKLFREIEISNQMEFIENEVNIVRTELSAVAAEIAFLPNLSKYVIETSIIVGALILSAFQFLAQDSTHAIATLAVFMAAGSRIAPAFLRIQQGILVIKNSSGAASGTMKLIAALHAEPDNFTAPQLMPAGNFIPKIEISNMKFRFRDDAISILDIPKLNISLGSRIAIVGPSGSGKSTLSDLILGVTPPTEGSVKVSGIEARDAFRNWPGKIGYVPQEVWLFDGTIQENIVLGRFEKITAIELDEIIEISNLKSVIENLPLGLNTRIGSNGFTLSGGQRQRIGIARAISSNPDLIILDEATSALDSIAEQVISDAITKLSKQTTVIVVAHRLASIRDFDRVIYLENGKILADGNFNEVRKLIPDFNLQANILGITQP